MVYLFHKKRWLFAAGALLGALGVFVALVGSDGLFSRTPSDELGPPHVNADGPPTAAPRGMRWIPGGVFWMGCEDFTDAVPVHKVRVNGFWMDVTEVTNAEFRRFVEDTGYVTVAEKAPDIEEIMKLTPGLPPPPREVLVPGSMVFAAPPRRVALDDISQWWRWVPGASWQHPEGPGSTLDGRDQHPVVHIAHQDARAYGAWRGKKEGGNFRLPTEAEWEFAARGGLDRRTFVWGNELRPGGSWHANIWQGDFPTRDTKADGFSGPAPVGSFPPNNFGLFDMAGNVWEWCADWYRADYYTSSPNHNPAGPSSSDDPLEPGVPKRVQRGGSFLCCDEYCKRYVPGARGKGEPNSSTNHIGFRCVRDHP